LYCVGRLYMALRHGKLEKLLLLIGCSLCQH